MILEKAIKVSSLIGGFFIFCGTLNFLIYFRAFNINILSYLELSEILLSFFNTMIIGAVAIGLSLLGSLYVITRRKKTRHTSRKNKISVLGLILRMLNHILGDYYEFRIKWAAIITAIITAFLIIVLFISFLFNSSNPTSGNYIYLSIVISICTFFYIILFTIPLTFEFKSILLNTGAAREKSLSFLGLYASQLFLLLTILLTSIDIVKKINQSGDYEVTIVTNENQIIKTDSSYYYVGKTNNYIFSHSNLDNHTDVFPFSTVKKISYLRKR